MTNLTNVTAAGVAQLHQALPKCTIMPEASAVEAEAEKTQGYCDFQTV